MAENINKLKKQTDIENFKAQFHKIQTQAHEISVDHGWWDNPPEDGTFIAGIHRELSEAYEDLRNGKGYMPYTKQDGKPAGVPSELADVIIMCMNFAEYHNIDLAEAITTKMEFNRTRPHMHGGKRF